MKTIINHPMLGEVEVSQTYRARRLSISLRPPSTVRLTIPYSISVPDALRFLEDKYDWIEAGLAKFKQEYPDTTIEMPYSTRDYSLRYNPIETDKISAKLTATEFIVSYPMSMHFSDSRIQDITKRAIDLAWSHEANKTLPPRVKELADEFHFKYGKIALRNTRSKWGSCTSKNDISLSIHLMHIPDYLVDYIILHELCHTVHKNHGEHFHSLLRIVTHGLHDTYRKELKKYSTRNCYHQKNNL